MTKSRMESHKKVVERESEWMNGPMKCIYLTQGTVHFISQDLSHNHDHHLLLNLIKSFKTKIYL